MQLTGGMAFRVTATSITIMEAPTVARRTALATVDGVNRQSTQWHGASRPLGRYRKSTQQPAQTRRKWQQISLWGYQHAAGPIIFSGELTQYNACLTRSCSGTNNAPITGWNQLYSAVNGDSRTSQATLLWSTDINWG